MNVEHVAAHTAYLLCYSPSIRKRGKNIHAALHIIYLNLNKKWLQSNPHPLRHTVGIQHCLFKLTAKTNISGVPGTQQQSSYFPIFIYLFCMQRQLSKTWLNYKLYSQNTRSEVKCCKCQSTLFTFFVEKNMPCPYD